MGKAPFTILAVLFLAATLIAVMLFLPEKAFISVDVNGIDAQVPLLPGAAENLTIKNLEWMGKDQPFYLVMSSKSLSTEWTDFAFTFTPKKDSEVSIILKGLHSGGADESLVAAYHCIQIIGAVPENADFKLQADTPKLSELDGGMPADNPNDKTAPPMLMVVSGTSYKALISVKKDTPATIKFSAKIASKRNQPAKAR
jgi:hypothetical protein